MGLDWRQVSDLGPARANQRAQLLLATRDYPRAWEVADALGPDTYTEFWRHFSPYGLGQEFPHVSLAAERLISVGRRAAALTLLELYVQRGVNKTYACLIARALEEILQVEPEDPELRQILTTRLRDNF